MNVKINLWQIDCYTSKTKREDILSGFKTSTDIAMIVNVHILDEGVNIDVCDSVFVAQPNDNIANLVQRMSIGNRITPNKNVCYVYLWAVQKKVDAILDYVMNNTSNFCKDKIFKMNFDKPVIKVARVIVKPKEQNVVKQKVEIDIAVKSVKVIKSKTSKFHCLICDYKTDVKQSFNKHNKSDKHICNAQNKGMLICDFCGLIFETKLQKWRHMQKCDQRVINEVQNIDEKNIDDVGELVKAVKVIKNVISKNTKK
jgi:superfamily II DNA or RNA helicase